MFQPDALPHALGGATAAAASRASTASEWSETSEGPSHGRAAGVGSLEGTWLDRTWAVAGPTESCVR